MQSQITYEIRDNGTKPFTVTVDSKSKTAKIYSTDDGVIGTYNYERIFIGKDCEFAPAFDGNTILCKLGTLPGVDNTEKRGEYMFIGPSIYKFEAPEITSYHSKIERGDPYPVAINKCSAYILVDKLYAPISQFTLDDCNYWCLEYLQSFLEEVPIKGCPIEKITVIRD